MVHEKFYSKELQRHFWLDAGLLKFTWDDNPVELKQTMIDETTRRKSDLSKKSQTSDSLDNCFPARGISSSTKDSSVIHEKLNPTMTLEHEDSLPSENTTASNNFDNTIDKEDNNSISFSSSANKKVEHSVFLYLSNMADRIKCKKFVTECLYGPIYILYHVFNICILLIKIKLTFQLGMWHSLSTLFYITFLPLLMLINIGKGLLMFTEKKLPFKVEKVVNLIINDVFHDELESVMFVCFTLAGTSGLISQVLHGECPESESPLVAVTYCSQLYQSSSPPIDGVLWIFNGLLTLLICFKNVRKIIIFLMWLLTSATVIWSVIYLRSWSQSWLFGTCIIYAFYYFEIERTRIFAFIKSEETLEEQKKIHRFEVKHDLEIAELKIAHEENLRKAEIDQMRALIGNVAHDLKTPIHCVKNEIESLRCSYIDAVKKYPDFQFHMTEFHDMNPVIALEDMEATLDFMTNNIGRFQDFTQASLGVALAPIIVTFSLSASLKFARRLMKHQLRKGEENRITLCPISEDICDNIMSEQHWFEENVICLLSNALKYSNRGTPVMIKLELVSEDQLSTFDLMKSHVEDFDESKSTSKNEFFKNRDALLKINQINKRRLIRVSVIDNGVGIPEKKLQELFQPFKQGQRMAGGTGLGLYSMSKRLKALKGFYGIEPRYDGLNGSVFWFAFSYRADHSTNYDTISNTFDRIKEKAAFPLRFLIVDDTVSILKMTAKHLRKTGYYVEVVDNGTEALERLKDGFHTQDFDVVLTDIQMPTMDGFEFVRQYREFERNEMLHLRTDTNKLRLCSNREGKLLIMSMSANSYCRVGALEAGIDHFMEKPFKLNSFLEELHKMMVVHHRVAPKPEPLPVVNEIK